MPNKPVSSLLGARATIKEQRAKIRLLRKALRDILFVCSEKPHRMFDDDGYPCEEYTQAVHGVLVALGEVKDKAVSHE